MKFVLLVLFLTACASKPSFKPEVDGNGDVAGKKGGVVYSIPERNPFLKMRLDSAPISKSDVLNVRMYFLRKGPAKAESMNPKELYIVIADSQTKIYPSRVHSDASAKPMIHLTDAQKQSVELEFKLPIRKDPQYPSLEFHWMMHYQENGKDVTVTKNEKFDYIPKEPVQQGVGQYEDDSDFPFMHIAPYPVEWETPGWIWWGPPIY